MKIRFDSSERGFAIPIVMFFLLIFSTQAFFMNQKFLYSAKGASGFRQRTELDVIRLTLTNNISCSDTWEASIPQNTPFDYDATCKANSQNIGGGSKIKLKRLTKNGVKDVFGSPSAKCSDADYEAAGYCIRASCSASENSIVVQAIPTTRQNVLTKNPIEWNSPKSLVVGGSAKIYVCSRRPPGRFQCAGTSCINNDSDIYDLGTPP